MTKMIQLRILLITLISSFVLLISCDQGKEGTKKFKLNSREYFQKQGANIFIFSNWYNGLFSDSKMSGVEIIQHEVRTVTNGDVRLDPTPEQWDEIPQFEERIVDQENQTIEARLSYPKYNFNYTILSKPEGNGILVSVILENPLPEELAGKAGFNLEFLPSAYFEKSYYMDEKSGVFPLYPSSSMKKIGQHKTEPLPLSTGKTVVFAPDDPERKIFIDGKGSELLLYDGRNKAQNGWFVLRSLLPANKTGTVLEWYVEPNAISNWLREPVISYSQAGYHPEQKKMAVIELDKNDSPLKTARLIKVLPDGNQKEIFTNDATSWGEYLRYNYLTFDFSDVKEPGVYLIEYQDHQTKPFRIDPDILVEAWHPTLDIFFPVQMDHMFVNEAYRVWHGRSHMDDALQAPINHTHFDLYAQGPTTDTPYKPGEHIPGLNMGGWYDAGDFDIRTQTQYATVQTLVHIWEDFKLTRDETLIDQKTKYVDIHHPDGQPDILQQIEHGTLALISHFRAVGHAIPGIICSDITQYTHLGDGLTKTDNLIYSPKLDSLESDGFRSGTFDDRWAFTSRTSALNYGSIAALAASGRALKNYNPDLAQECLTTAIKVWEEEQSHEPYTFRHGNTTGGPLEAEELKATIELYLTTKEKKYMNKILQLWPVIERGFRFNASLITRILPMMDEKFKNDVKALAQNYKFQIDSVKTENPFGVPITTGGWAGNGAVVRFAINNYALYKNFPDIMEKDDVFRGLNYLLGCHPGSNISFVSAVGTHSKKVAYGNNRADFSFIAGGIVPGVLILPPDFPENKEDWPFLWGENEYVIGMGATYIYLVNAANDLLE